MVKNKLLSICIPTFNRPEILKDNLLFMLPEIKKFFVSVYISDDSSNNLTKEMIKDIQKKYKYIFYIRNKPSLGHDKNNLKSLTLPNSAYVWLLGDSQLLKKNAIKNTLKVITQMKPEIIAVNSENRESLNIDGAYYSNCNKVFNDLCWHLTLTGASIYSQKIISTIDEIDLKSCKNFPQISLIFNHLSKSCSFYWINKNLIFTRRTKKFQSYWVNNVFKVFIDDFTNVIFNLPECYGDTDKEKVIVNHSLKTKVFSFNNLLKFRSLSIYNYHSFRKYSRKLAVYSKVSILNLMFISLIPKFIISFLLKIDTKPFMSLIKFFGWHNEDSTEIKN